MRELILLGAGASAEADVPTAYEMAKAIGQEFRKDPLLQQETRVVDFVIGGLLFQAGIRGHDPLSSGVNVEELFNAVQLLAERHTLEAAPFVGSWHSMVEELDTIAPSSLRLGALNEAIYTSTRDEILRAFSESPPSSEASKVDKALEKAMNRFLAAAARKTSVSLHSDESVGRAVDAYITEVVKRWTVKLKNSRPRSASDLVQRFTSSIRVLVPFAQQCRTNGWAWRFGCSARQRPECSVPVPAGCKSGSVAGVCVAEC